MAVLNCTIPTFEQTVNFVKNKAASLYQITGDASQGEIGQMLRHSKEHIRLNTAATSSQQGDDNLRYGIFNPATGTFSDVLIANRVTDRTARAFRRGRTKQEVDAIRNNPNNIIKREYGTATHKVLQDLGERYYKSKKGLAVDPIDYTAYDSMDYPFSKDQVDALNEGVKEIIDQIWEIQQTIDPNQIPLIEFENPIFDPTRDESGTMDIVAIFSDRTGMVVDYKTFTPRSSYIKGSGAKKELVSSDFIDPSVQEKWKLQQSIYKRILLTHYGVKDIRATRVAPIWVDILGEWNQDEGKFELIPSLNKIQIGRKQSEYLRNIAAGYEKTVISPIDELIEENYKRAERIRARAKALPKDERYAANLRAKEIETAILDLTEDKDMSHLLNSVLADANSLYARFQKDPTSVSIQQLNNVIDLIQALSSFDLATQENIQTMKNLDVKLYDNIREVFRNQAAQIEGLRQILSVFTEHRLGLILDEVGDTQGRIRREGTDLIMQEDSYFRQTFLPTSDMNNPLVKRAGYIFEKAYEEGRQELMSIHAKMEPAEEDLRAYAKATGQTITQVYQSMIDPSTGNFYNKLSEKFKNDRATAVANRDLSFFTKYYKVKSKNQFGETFDEWFKRSFEEQKEMLEATYSWMDAGFRSDRVERELRVWVANNELRVHRVTGDPISPDAWMRKNVWLTITDQALTDYASEQWKKISSTPALVNYYNMITSIIRELRPVVGYSNISGSGFLPKVRAEFMEKLSQGGMGYLTDSARGFGEDLRHMFSIREGDVTFGQVDPETGKVEKTIPVLYTNPFKDANGKVDVSQQSHDISKTVRLFAHMAYTYKYMKQSEAEIIAIKEILKKVKYYEQSESGKKVFNFMHNIAVKDKTEGGSMTDRVMNNLVDYHLYGVKVQPFQGKMQLTRNILRAKQYLTLKALGLGFIPAGASYVAARTSAWFEGAKGMAYTEQQWRKATMNQAKEMGKYHALGYFFGVHSENELIDQLSARSKGTTIFRNPAYSAKLLQYINERALMRPFSYGDERIDNHVINSMALNYGFDAEGNLRRLSNLPEGSKNIWDMFSVNDKGEVNFEGTPEQILQFKRAARATQRGIKGTTNSEDISYAQTDLILNVLMQFRTWMPGVLNERFSGLKYNEIIDAPQWGRYKALLDETEMKNSANTAFYILGTTANTLYHLGKNLLLYNRISRAVTKGDIQLNDELNQNSYRKYLTEGGDRRVTYEDFLAIKRSQIRAMVSELEILLVLSALIFSMGADWDDDGEPMYKEMFMLQKLYQIMNRTRTELTFSYDPMSYATLMRNAIPLSSLAIDASRIINNTLDEAGDELFGETTTRLPFPFGANRGGRNDPTDKFHYSMGIIPGGFQLRRLLNLTEADQAAIK